MKEHLATGSTSSESEIVTDETGTYLTGACIDKSNYRYYTNENLMFTKVAAMKKQVGHEKKKVA